MLDVRLLQTSSICIMLSLISITDTFIASIPVDLHIRFAPSCLIYRFPLFFSEILTSSAMETRSEMVSLLLEAMVSRFSDVDHGIFLLLETTSKVTVLCRTSLEKHRMGRRNQPFEAEELQCSGSSLSVFRNSYFDTLVNPE
ncbi:hypothetical protein L6452_36400 [Arctium lappa]|uniref:Uncharacterized protein n=1 Tax=Arctium lappa TaxID=4217 RepID=A0ACB8Y926_ARCLA|nr:hypothetical protein L6452_36400 [Arctium lappa]